METPQETVKKLPHTPGVYIYKNEAGVVLYVGKAKDLKRRVSQYFQRDDAVGAKTELLVSQINSIETISTQSEFDALLLEAKLIHEYYPKYNVIAKDDKSPLYIEITMDEELPRILYIRRPKNEERVVNAKRLLFGPFQSGRTARTVLRQLRPIAPYCTQKQRNGRPCFYTHLGLCSPCPSVIAKLPDTPERKILVSQYRRNMRHIGDILSGKSTAVVADLEKEMRGSAQKNAFEEAGRLKQSIDRLHAIHTHHYDPALYMQSASFAVDISQTQMETLRSALLADFPDLKNLHRIECFDISNTMGTFSTASMVVLIDGISDRSQYRRFRIRTKEAPNDFAMMREVVGRRFTHAEWQFPDLVVIDGGKGQLSNAMEALAVLDIRLPVISLAKREEEIIVAKGESHHIIRLSRASPGLHLLQKIRDESHRFAITYHRLLRRKNFL